MKLIIDINDKCIKGIKLLAKEQSQIARPLPTLEQIIANGIPYTKFGTYIDGYMKGLDVLDKISEEIVEYKDDKVIHYERNEMIDIVLGIIDKYREGEQDHGHTERD